MPQRQPQDDMNVKWLIAVILAIAVPVGGCLINQSAKGQALERDVIALDRREMGHVQDQEHAIERAQVQIDKMNANVEWLVKEVIAFRAEMRVEKKERDQ